MIEPKPNIILSIGKLVINDKSAPSPEKLDDRPNKLIHPNISPMMNISIEARRLLSLSFFPTSIMILANKKIKPTNAMMKSGVPSVFSPKWMILKPSKR